MLLWMSGWMSLGHAQTNESLVKELDQSYFAAAEALLQIERIGEAQKLLNKVSPKGRELEFRFLKAMADQGRVVLDSISGIQQAIAVHQEQGLVAIGGTDKNIYVCRISDQKVLNRLSGHSGAVTTLDFSPDGKSLVSGSRDKSVKVWDLLNGENMITNSTDFSQGIYQVRYNPDGKKIGVVSWELKPEYGVNGFAILLNAIDLRKISKKDTDQHPATGIVFHPTLPKCYVSTWGEIVYGYTLPDWKLEWKYDLSDPSAYNAFNAIDISGDGQLLALGNVDHTVHLLQTSTGKLKTTLQKNPALSRPIKTLDFNADGKSLAVSGDDGIVSIWDIGQKKLTEKLVGHKAAVNAVSWIGPTSLLSLSQDSSLRVWDVKRSFLREGDICDFGPWQLPVWQSRMWFVAPCSDEKLSIYDVHTGAEIKELGKVKGLCGSINDAGFLITADFNGVVSIWDLNQQTLVKHCKGHKSRVDGVAWLKDGSFVSVGDRMIRRWSSTGMLIDSLTLNYAPFRVAAFGEQMVVSNSQQLVVYDIITWKETKRLILKNTGVQEMMYSPRGTFFAVFTGKNIEVFRPENWDVFATLEGHEQIGYGLDFSIDEQYILSGSYDQTMRIWDMKNAKNTLTFHGINAGVYGCRFVGSNSVIASSGEGKVFTFKF